MARSVAPYGAWRSPFPIDLLTEGVVYLAEPQAEGGRRWWLEGRPDEGGRQVLVRRDRHGTITRLTPEGFNARDRVHEYGGAAVLVAGNLVVVSDFATGRLHRVTAPEQLEPLTPDRAWYFADAVLDPRRNRLIAVREDHEPATLERHGEAENALVSIDLASGDVGVLAEGADFYAAPRLSPDGEWLAYTCWSHPNMPWDETELRLARVTPDGLGDDTGVAGRDGLWVSQPRWSPDGVLHFAAETTGWMNLYRRVGDRVEAVTDAEVEFASPEWQFGNHTYDFLPDGSIVAIGRRAGREWLYRIGPRAGDLRVLDVPWTEMPVLAVDGDRVFLRGASPDAPSVLADLDPDSGTFEVVRRSMQATFDPADVSVPELVEFPTTGGRTAFGLFYRPTNRSVEGPPGERPPLVVTSHGGPTSSAYAAFSTNAQLFASRGIALLDVDYGGSTGYGRDYRKRLEGEWGVVDVDDCVAGARFLAERGDVAPNRLAIRGGSASGYTTLAAITFRDGFDAGVSYFGIGDLSNFVGDTHKFESRYTERLVGPWPAAKQLYHDRSPVFFADRIRCPVLILQGLDDRVVPPAEAELIVDALWERRVPHAYIAFEGEDHGFRKASSIIRSFEAELSFYGQVFGFEPADDVPRLELAFADETPETAPA